MENYSNGYENHDLGHDAVDREFPDNGVDDEDVLIMTGYDQNFGI